MQKKNSVYFSFWFIVIVALILFFPLIKKTFTTIVGKSESTMTEESVYAAHVQPILDNHCIQCHGVEKQKGGLRLDSYENLMAGGDSGFIVVSGDSKNSALTERIRLPLNDDDHMPPEGKLQLSAVQIELLDGWVAQGASSEKTLRELDISHGVADYFDQEKAADECIQMEGVRRDGQQTMHDEMYSVQLTAEQELIQDEFHNKIEPVFISYCYDCHGDGQSKGGLSLDSYSSILTMQEDRDTWQKVRDYIRYGIMPPKKKKQPLKEDRHELAKWIDKAVFPVDVDNPDPGHVTLRRLNRVEFKNTIFDLTGVEVNLNDGLPEDDTGYGFDNIGDVLSLAPSLFERYLVVIQNVLDRVFEVDENSEPEMQTAYNRIFVPREEVWGDQDYLKAVLGKLASRAYRRPIKEDELMGLVDLAQRNAKLQKSLEVGLRVGIEAILISPQFLFREITDDTFRPEHYKIDEHTLASRMSYFLWSTMPDDKLLSLADSGKLRQNLDNEIKRMMEHPLFEKEFISNFIGQWFQLRDIEQVYQSRRMRLFNNLRSMYFGQLMRMETEKFIYHIINEGRPITDIINADYTFVNWKLAGFYGWNVKKGKGFEQVSLAGDKRSGLLTQASILMLSSYPDRTSPVIRGKWILEKLLDMPLPPPPPEVPALVEESKENKQSRPRKLNMREQIVLHRDNPKCTSCHSLMDPLGFALENFDQAGRWRDNYEDMPIDTSGVLPSGRVFQNYDELKEILVTEHLDDFLRSTVKHVLTYALGRGLEYYDRLTVDSIVEKLKANDLKFSVLINEVIHSVPFQMKRGSKYKDKGESI